jgi:hypothetical protein
MVRIAQSMEPTMNDVPLHRLYHHYSELPYSQRVLYTATLLVLGLGYIFALLNINFTYAGRAGGDRLIVSYDDIVAGYSGTGKGSRLESALRGPMSTMLPPDESNALVIWAQDGGSRAAYDGIVKATLDKRCMACHDGSNPHLPNLNGYDNLKKMTEVDTGASIATLVRVSHIHFFGLTFIFFIVGLMFSHAYVRPVWFKCTVIALPFVAIVMDVSSWYFTKIFHPFAFVVMAAGFIMAVCFASMWFVTMYQLWFSPPPAPVAERGPGVDTTNVG